MENGKKSVAEMISVFSTENDSTASSCRSTSQPCLSTECKKLSLAQKKEVPKEQVISLTDKSIIVSETKAFDPRYFRTLEHFSRNPVRGKTQSSSFIQQRTNSSTRSSEAAKTLPKQISKTFVTPEKHPGGVYYRKTSSSSTLPKTGAHAKKGSSSSPTSNKKAPSASLPNSPSQGSICQVKQPGGVWYSSKPKSTSSGTAAAAPVKRSNSFTSHITVNINPNDETKTIKKRSSVVFDVSDESDNNNDKQTEKKTVPPKPLPKPTSKFNLNRDMTRRCEMDVNKMSVRERASIFSSTGSTNTPLSTAKQTSKSSPKKLSNMGIKSAVSNSQQEAGSTKKNTITTVSVEEKKKNQVKNNPSLPSSAGKNACSSIGQQVNTSRIALRKTESPLFVPVKKEDTSGLQLSSSFPSSSISHGSVKSMIAKFSHSSNHATDNSSQSESVVFSNSISSRILAESSTDESSSSDDDTESTIPPSHRLRIPSSKDDDDELVINVYDEDLPPVGSNQVLISHEEVEDDQKLVLDESSLHIVSMKEGFDDKGVQTATDSTNDLDTSPIYSYQQYTLKHRQSRSSTTSLLSSASADASTTVLDIIPEHDSANAVLSPQQIAVQPEQCSITNTAVGSSSDSERELVRKMSSVSLSFYKEVLETINQKVGPPTSQSEDQAEHINQVVDEIIRNKQHQQSSDSENVYETIEEYSRKVSDYVIRHREMERKKGRLDDDDCPPELPPRPVFLLKLSEEREEISILDNDSIDSIREASPSKFNTETDSVSSFTLLSPKKRKKAKVKSSPERDEKARSRIGSRSESSRHGIKKKLKQRSLFKSKVEPKNLSETLSTSLPATSNYEEMNDGGSSSYTAEYVNTQVVSSDIIQPTNTSESESEVGLLDTHTNEVSSIEGSQSPTKVKWRDEALHQMTHDEHPITPDSGVYPEINGRYLRNPLTPPLVTKLGVSGLATARTIRFSNSDPSLHSTLLLSSRRSNHVPESPSFSHVSVESDDIETSQTPSISSFESGRYITAIEQQKKSPSMRKRVRSDATSDRPMNSSGAIQKNNLLNSALRKRRGSLQENNECSDSIIEVPLVHADVLMDRSTGDPDELSFTVHDVIAVLDMTDDDWWQGMVEDRIGWFPASWVRLRIGQEDTGSTNDDDTLFASSQQLHHLSNNPISNSHDETTAVTTDSTSHTATSTSRDVVSCSQDFIPQKRKLSRRMTITKRSTSDFPRKLTSSEIRARCIEEILTTEREYVQHLNDIVEGFLEPCEQHTKLFTSEIIGAVFSNIKEIYQLQQLFLSQLTDCIDTEKLQDSRIGHLFVKMGEEFCIYSEYCNNHPNAVNEMSILRDDPQYTYFFESCRLLRNLTDISLEGFLLTPVQRICRYPLQLSELVKHTPEDHPDFPHVQNAQKVMTRVAMVINERKKRMEDISKVSLWQESVEAWKGPDVLEKSSMMIHSGELHKISKGHSQERHFFLFDHQMIYCKKDTIGGKLSYKGRVDMDKCKIYDIKDGKITHNASGLKNAWKMNNADKDDKVYVLYAKSSQSKQQWMDAFVEERRIVAEDKEKGFVLTPKMKKSAIAIGLASANATLRRKSVTKKSHVIIDTSLTNSTVDAVGVAQVKTNIIDRTNNKAVGSPNESRKRLIGKKK